MSERQERGRKLQARMDGSPELKAWLERMKSDFEGCRLLGVEFPDGETIGSMGDD